MSDYSNENLVEVARAFNTADFTVFRPLLALDFVYTNHKNGILVKGKLLFLNYIQDVFEVMKFDTLVFAELGYVTNNNTANKEEMSCVTLGEGNKEHNSTLIIIQEKDGKISQMNLYIIKDPQWINIKRTHVYPGYVENIYVRYMHFTIRPNRITYLGLCQYANTELGYIRESPLDWPTLRNWYMRYTGVFDYIYDELVYHPEVVAFKNNHHLVNFEISEKNDLEMSLEK